MPGEVPTRPRILSRTAALYGCFTGVTLLGFAWEPLQLPAYFTWPYLFLLSAQRFVSNPAGATSWVVSLVIGLVLVLACAWVAQYVLARKRLTVIQLWGMALLSVVLPLGALSGVTWAIACAAGWPVGE